MNGSHTSQGGIPMTAMSQIKTAFFITLASAPPSPSLLHLYSFVSKCHSVPGTQLISTQRVGHRHEGALLAPSPHTGIKAAVNMKELYLHLTSGSSVSELIRSRPKNSSNVDEPAMRLGAETWRNTVGGGTVSGLWAMLWKGSLEVLLLSRFSCVQLCATP